MANKTLTLPHHDDFPSEDWWISPELQIFAGLQLVLFRPDRCFRKAAGWISCAGPYKVTNPPTVYGPYKPSA